TRREHEPAVPADRIPHNRVVTRQRCRHLHLVGLPPPGRALNVREQERHGSRRKRRHRENGTTVRPAGQGFAKTSTPFTCLPGPRTTETTSTLVPAASPKKGMQAPPLDQTLTHESRGTRSPETARQTRSGATALPAKVADNAGSETRVLSARSVRRCG